MKNSIKVALYDSHTWEGESQFSGSIDGVAYEITLRDLSDRPNDMDYYLICDGLVDTKFPLFFPKTKRVAVLKETPAYYAHICKKKLERRFQLVVTHLQELVDNIRNSKLVEFSSNWIARDPSWTGSEDKTKLVSFIGNINHDSSQAYDLRRDVAHSVLEDKRVDAYGIGINPIEFKSVGLADYRFSIALENNRCNYYFTEKIIDCFLSSTVPIYYGCPDITKYYDERGIIRFSTVEELKDILDSLSKDLYLEMRPFVEENKKRCLDYKHNSFHSYWHRVISKLDVHHKHWLETTSKQAAAVRFVGEKVGLYF